MFAAAVILLAEVEPPPMDTA
ncbi:hypothetical protein A2U01_0074499, partial [Trifolium medium]|nr:hypothetical protein [Trifolium medium]